MLLHRVVRTSRRVSEVTGRGEKIDLLALLLREARSDEIEIVIAFLSGAPRQGRIGIGPAGLQQAGVEQTVADPELDLREVDRAFEQIAKASGRGSAKDKVRILRSLTERATEGEHRFLIRLLAGELRQGALEGLLTESVARATGISGSRIRRAVMATGDLGTVARIALAEGERGLSSFAIQPLHPVLPMLAQPADDITEALDRMGKMALEFKLDGARIQVHKVGDEVRVFSRRLRDVTHAVPEIVQVMAAMPVRDVMLDGEVIALRPDGTPHSFQVTMRRFGRKLDVERMQRELPLTPAFFDLLYLDDQDLTDEVQALRFRALGEIVEESLLVPHTITGSADEARAFLQAAMQQGHEGIMAKDLSAPYAAGSRGRAWLKVKPAHTLDLVVLGAEWGHGRRRGWLSNLHLGARDPARGTFVMLGKTFKGLTHAMLAWQTQRLLELEVGRDRHTVYVRPELVAEVAFNDVQESPHYPSGLALRFARVKRYRTDKTAEAADTLQTVQGIYSAAAGRGVPHRR